MEEMVTEKRIAMVQLQADKYKADCLPFPTRVLEEIQEALPIVANKKNEDLLTIIKVSLFG